jgi:hypothetical protein
VVTQVPSSTNVAPEFTIRSNIQGATIHLFGYFGGGAGEIPLQSPTTTSSGFMKTQILTVDVSSIPSGTVFSFDAHNVGVRLTGGIIEGGWTGHTKTNAKLTGFTYDTVAPILQGSDDVGSLASKQVQIVFSESVLNTGLTGGSPGGMGITGAAVSGAKHYADGGTFTGATGVFTFSTAPAFQSNALLMVDIPANAVTDLAGNTNAPSTIQYNTTTQPSINSVLNAGTATITVVFNKAVTSNGINNGTATAMGITGAAVGGVKYYADGGSLIGVTGSFTFSGAPAFTVGQVMEWDVPAGSVEDNVGNLIPYDQQTFTVV